MYAHLFSSLEHIDGGGAEGGAEGGGEGGGGEGSGGEGGIEVEAVAAAADAVGQAEEGGVRRRDDFHRVEHIVCEAYSTEGEFGGLYATGGGARSQERPALGSGCGRGGNELCACGCGGGACGGVGPGGSRRGDRGGGGGPSWAHAVYTNIL